MNELDELLATLESWAESPYYNMAIRGELKTAFAAYKAATPPLVLEAVEFPESGDEMIVMSGEYIAYRCACYRLPEGET